MDLTYHFDNLKKHDVTPDEVDECLVDPQKIVLKKKNSVLIVGKDFSGRVLEIGINEKGFVYHAMDASKFCYNYYKKRNIITGIRKVRGRVFFCGPGRKKTPSLVFSYV